MAGTGNVTLAGNVTGNPGGARSFGPITITASAAVENDVTIALSSGNNTISIPSGTTLAIISGPNAVSPTPNPAYGGVLTLKGVSGDTGSVISASGPTLLCWAGTTPPSSIVINATVSCSLTLWCM